MQDVQSLVKLGKRGPEFKGLVITPQRLKAGEGFLDSGVVGEHAVQGGELQHHADLLIGGGKTELALAAADLL